MTSHENSGGSMFVLGGSIAFLLYVIYDINSVKWNHRVLHYGFLTGTLLLVLTTIGVVFQKQKHIENIEGSSILLLCIAAIFFVLLIYTLFFALPFDETYQKESEKRLAYTDGVYALCRHPGVLWFIGFYLFLAWGLKSRDVWVYGIVMSAWNILYVILQDRYSFPLTFSNYGTYQKDTPFLLPTRKSIGACLNTLHRKKN